MSSWKMKFFDEKKIWCMQKDEKVILSREKFFNRFLKSPIPFEKAKKL